MTRKKFIDSEHAISEVVDFSIILAMMLLAVAIIGVAGFPLVDHMQESGHTENIRQSFIVLTANLNKVVFGNAPSQSIELKVNGGSISATGDSNINVTMQAWNSSTSSIETQYFERQMRMIENVFEERSICYEGTAAWAQYPTGDAVMISKPQYVFNDNVLVIPVPMITGSSSVSGVGLVHLVSNGGEPSVYKYQNVSCINITIMSKYYRGWERYLNDTLEMQIITVDNTNTTVYSRRDYADSIDVYAVQSQMGITIE
ncbi:MAG: hypothetical protein E4G94_03865 [ANME-2 cluster archaeon]|nr:MAG: hypothetical protein E4G94_03865 [ANME-2 cluster archaeon]